jgi:pyruvate dehydrogenase E2 component (dihydrolipoamide acetyltransferase)
MARPLVMPQMGYDMKEGTILRWLKHEGDRVERGEPIAEIETDKVNLEIESFASGVILKVLAKEGETVPVGQLIALIGEPGEKVEEEAVPAPAVVGAATAAGTVTAPGPRAPEAAPLEEGPTAPGERVRASPLVRRLAAEHGIDLSKIRGSGPGGRIVKEDILSCRSSLHHAHRWHPSSQLRPRHHRHHRYPQPLRQQRRHQRWPLHQFQDCPSSK